MKYGLRSDDSKKNKWKILMEQDVANLKTEVFTLKQQLKNCLNIINILSSKVSDETSIKGLKDILDGTMLLKYFPAWAYDSGTELCGCFHSVITKDKSFEELRLEDYDLNSRFLKQNSSVKGFTKVQNPIDKMPVDKDTRSHIQEEEPLSQITSHLQKINKNMTFLTSNLSKMDINLSEINSQLSIMDSRLSAIDMFVTMQHVDRKWQELTSRLQTIENDTETSELSNNNNIKEMLLLEDSVVLNNSMQKPCNLSQDITTKDTALMSNSSNVNNLGDKSSEIVQTDYNSNADVSFEKAKFEVDKVSNYCSSQIAVFDTHENSKLQSLTKTFSNKFRLNNKLCNSRGDKDQQNSITPVSSKSGSEVVHDSKKLTPEHSKESLIDKTKNHSSGENLSVEESEFVFINKSDIDVLYDQRAEEAKINLYSNITEYLEENLKKKKDSVYEFSFNKYLRDRQIQESTEETI